MALTPEEIAYRAFTPSADGYHQGEVRSFLNRIATHLHALQVGLPEGRAELAEIIATLNSREPRLNRLEQQLALVSSELAAATEQLRHTQADAATQLTAAQRIAADQRAARELAAQQQAILDQLTATSTQAAEHLRAIEGLAVQTLHSAAAVEQLVASTSAAGARVSAQPTAVVADPIPVAASTGATSIGSAPASTVRPATPQPAATDPIDVAALEAPRQAAKPLPLFGSDRNQPLFSDSANDLLDGVLDDVMGNLTDEGR